MRKITVSIFLKLGWAAFCAIIAILMTGCGDPVRTTMQPVLLKVTDSVSGRPVTDAEVSLRYDFDHYVPKTDEWSEWKRDTYKRFLGKTDANGKANVDVVWTVLDRTIGPTPPSWRDDVTGKFYLLRVAKEQVREEHSLAMQPGATIRGQAFTVQVLEIQQPRYIKTSTASAPRKPNH